MDDLRNFETGIRACLTSQDLQSKLTELVRLAAESARSKSASLYLLDETGTVLKPAALYQVPDSYVKGCGEVLIGDQCCGRAVQLGKPWIVTDMLTDPLFAAGREGAISCDIRAALSVPVRVRDGRIAGSLACHFNRPYTPTNYDIERNELWASIIGFTLSNFSAMKTAPRQAPVQTASFAD